MRVLYRKLIMLGNNANLLYGILITSGHRSAVELCARTKLSQPAVSRALSEIAKITGRLVTHRRTWAASATVLRSNGMIDRDCEEQIRLVELFGRCIANTDMHFGNLSFYWDAPASQSVRFRLAPLYDMLPMLYAPEKSEVVNRVFNLHSGTEYGKAGELAYSFWNRVSSHENVSNAFKELAIANAGLLSRVLS